MKKLRRFCFARGADGPKKRAPRFFPASSRPAATKIGRKRHKKEASVLPRPVQPEEHASGNKSQIPKTPEPQGPDRKKSSADGGKKHPERGQKFFRRGKTTAPGPCRRASLPSPALSPASPDGCVSVPGRQTKDGGTAPPPPDGLPPPKKTHGALNALHVEKDPPPAHAPSLSAARHKTGKRSAWIWLLILWKTASRPLAPLPLSRRAPFSRTLIPPRPKSAGPASPPPPFLLFLRRPAPLRPDAGHKKRPCRNDMVSEIHGGACAIQTRGTLPDRLSFCKLSLGNYHLFSAFSMSGAWPKRGKPAPSQVCPSKKSE